MSLFFKQFQHLLPSALAWRITVQKKLRSLFEGLTGTPSDARDYVDDVFEDAFPATTRTTSGALAEWQKQFGIQPSGDEAAQRLQLDAEWKAQGGQSPRYLQDTVQAAGFNIWIHEWWDPNGTPFEQVQCGQAEAQCGRATTRCSLGRIRRKVRNPHLYAKQPTIGTTQCGQPSALCGRSLARCSDFLANDPGYLVNKDLTPRAPPRIPTDPKYWNYFLYWGGETFPEPAVIPANRRAELERLLLKLDPAQQWLVLIAQYDGIFDDTFDASFQ